MAVIRSCVPLMHSLYTKGPFTVHVSLGVSESVPNLWISPPDRPAKGVKGGEEGVLALGPRLAPLRPLREGLPLEPSWQRCSRIGIGVSCTECGHDAFTAWLLVLIRKAA